MARRKKESPAEALIDLVALLPWYIGVMLAGAGYVFLHRIALDPVLTPVKPGNVAEGMLGAVGHGLAQVGQYIVPLICVIGAAISAWRRHERRSLVANVTRSDAPDILDNLSWREFEKLVGEGFRLQGYTVAENHEPGSDGGIDLTLRKGGEKYLVQCKQWRAFKVGVPVVRELYGVMAAKGAAGGFVVTSGRFTAEAEEFASGRNVQLIDGPRLHQLLKRARGGSESRKESGMAPQMVRSPAPQESSLAAPSCPKCAQSMVRRTAKKGANAGREFWGCSAYPSCRGVV